MVVRDGEAGGFAMSNEGQQAPPPPDPNYKPADTDSRLGIRFLGNTAQVADASLFRIDPFQLFAVAKWLEMQGERMLAMSENRQAGMGLQVARDIPPQGFKRPPG
jgi:hypothetical protein